MSAAKPPVKATLLSGFLGSGKTSLMRHVLANREGTRCAVIVNEISELNLDADILSGTKLIQADEQLVEMANGCICCTLREDLLNQLRELAASGKYDAVLIESSGIAEPMQVAETFFVEPADGKGKLDGVCSLDNCVTVVDASTFEEYMGRIDTVSAIDAKAKQTEDDRDIAALFVDQLEFANVVVLNKIDLIPAEARAAKVAQLTAFVKTISPRATVISTTNSVVPLDKVLGTGNFSLDFAQHAKDWMVDISSGIKHVPETLEYGVSSTMFRSSRPFHPQRLHDWITAHFMLTEATAIAAVDDLERQAAASEMKSAARAKEAAAETQAEAQRRKERRVAAYGNLFRGKGHVFIGSPGRHMLYGVWGQAGSILSLVGGEAWDDLPRPRGEKAAGPHQLLAFVGQDLNAERLQADLEACLMTADEEAAFRKHVAVHGPLGTVFPDPFEQWAEFREEGATDDDDEDECEEDDEEDEEGSDEEDSEDASSSDDAAEAPTKVNRSEQPRQQRSA